MFKRWEVGVWLNVRDIIPSFNNILTVISCFVIQEYSRFHILYNALRIVGSMPMYA